VDLVSLLKQELGQVRAVLPGNAGHQRFLHQDPPRQETVPLLLGGALHGSIIHARRPPQDPLVSAHEGAPSVRLVMPQK
jgi:hypothetical protein